MNKELVIKRFGKASGTYNREAVIQQQIACKMTGLLRQHLPLPCAHILEIGSGTGLFTRMLLKELQPEQLVMNDICPQMKECCADLPNGQVTFLPGDAEKRAFPDRQNLIASCSALQWFTSPEQFFERCHTLLRPQGYLAFSTFGKENMREVGSITGNGLPYRSKKELEEALAMRYDIVHAEEEIISLTFSSPLNVLYHLKQTGVTATGGQAWTKGALAAFCKQYSNQFSLEKGVSLTYHPIYIITKRKEQ